MRLPLHQQAADELGGNQLSGEAEEGLGKGLVERGGYGSGLGGSAEAILSANSRHTRQTPLR